MLKLSEDFLDNVRKRSRSQPVSTTPATERNRNDSAPVSTGAMPMSTPPEPGSPSNGLHTSTPPRSSEDRIVIPPQRRPSRKRRRPDDDYEVGYKRPPKSGQFQKGSSGNPKGRPKASRNARTIVTEAFFKTREVKLEGKKARLSQFEIGIQQIMNKFMTGDHKAVGPVMTLAMKFLGHEGSVTDEQDSPFLPMLTDSSKRMLARYQSDLLREADVPEAQISRVLERFGLPAPGAPNEADDARADDSKAGLDGHHDNDDRDDDVII